MYKPLQIIISPQTHNTKNLLFNRSSKYSPPPPPGGGLYLEIALKYRVKQSKNCKFPP